MDHVSTSRVEFVPSKKPIPGLEEQLMVVRDDRGRELLDRSEITPRVYDRGPVQWHACLRPAGFHYECFLIQGHGATPRSATYNAIVDARGRLARQAAALAAIEKAMGLHGVPDQDVIELGKAE